MCVFFNSTDDRPATPYPEANRALVYEFASSLKTYSQEKNVHIFSE